MTWQPIETAPKDGTEILAYREDAGIFLVKWMAPVEFMTEREVEEAGLYDWMEEEDWWGADFINGFRASNDGGFTHWQPLPPPPEPTK